MKIGFIGCGQMTGAMLSGLKRTNFIDEKDLSVYDRNPEKIEAYTAGTEIYGANSPVDLVGHSNLVFIAVRPKDAKPLCKEISSSLENKVVIFMAPGETTKQIEQTLPSGTKVVRIMPNSPLEVGEGMVPIAYGSNVSDEEGNFILDFFNSIGKAITVDESHFDILTALSGSGPAYAFYFIECLMDVAIQNGISSEDAEIIAAQTILGGTKVVLEANHGKSITELIDQICAPGTSSIEAMNVFRASDFKDVTIKAVNAALAKNIEMGKKSN